MYSTLSCSVTLQRVNQNTATSWVTAVYAIMMVLRKHERKLNIIVYHWRSRSKENSNGHPPLVGLFRFSDTRNSTKQLWPQRWNKFASLTVFLAFSRRCPFFLQVSMAGGLDPELWHSKSYLLPAERGWFAPRILTSSGPTAIKAMRHQTSKLKPFVRKEWEIFIREEFVCCALIFIFEEVGSWWIPERKMNYESNWKESQD